MSAHFHPVCLPGRELPHPMQTECISMNPKSWQLDLLGSVSLGFSETLTSLVVFKDLISKVVFYGEFDRIDEVYLTADEQTHWGLWVVYPEKLDQFCHYVMGWMPNVWDHETEDRVELVKILRKEFSNMEMSVYDDYREIYRRVSEQDTARLSKGVSR